MANSLWQNRASPSRACSRGGPRCRSARTPPEPVPEETARVARAAFPDGNPYIRMRDGWAPSTRMRTSRTCFPRAGKPAEAPWRLALVTIFQFAEDLSDRQAADAVRGPHRLEVRALAGADRPGLRSHRPQRVPQPLGRAAGPSGCLLDVLLRRFRERGLLKARGRQRTDSTHVLAAVRALNRLELVRETMRHALDVLAAVAPDWLRAHARREWVKRYERRSDEERLPKGKEAQRALADQIGRDGTALLDGDLLRPTRRPGCGRCRRWRCCGGSGSRTTCRPRTGVRWRTAEDGLPPAAQFISSPHDPDAHLRQEGQHLLGRLQGRPDRDLRGRPAQPDHPRRDDRGADGRRGGDADRSIEDLQAKGLLPAVHLVDTGFLDAELLVDEPAAVRRGAAGPDAQGPALAGPRRRGLRGRALRHGLGATRRPPARRGTTSIEWGPGVDNRGNDSVKIRFSHEGLRPLPQPRPVHRVDGEAPAANHRRPAATSSTRRCRQRRAVRGDARSTPGSTPDGRGSKAPSRRASGGAGCGARATSAWPRPTSGTS